MLEQFSQEESPFSPPTILTDIEQSQKSMKLMLAQESGSKQAVKMKNEELGEVEIEYQSYLKKKQKYEKKKKELEQRRGHLHDRIKTIEEYMQRKESLRKEMVFVSGAKRISYELIKSPKPMFVLYPDIGIHPKALILVLSKKKMGNMAKNAQYYVVLDKNIQYDSLAKQWTCEIPNLFRLTNKYFYFLSNFHRLNPNGIRIVPRSSRVPNYLVF